MSQKQKVKMPKEKAEQRAWKGAERNENLKFKVIHSKGPH
jgi:hypothetical protein